MTGLVLDASVAIKWVAPEALSDAAIALLDQRPLVAPDLLVAECANILWKKVRRDEMEHETAQLAAKAIERVDIELVPMRLLLAESVKLAIEIDHPAYDCIYLAVALQRDLPLVTADARLVTALRESRDERLAKLVLSLAGAPGPPA